MFATGSTLPSQFEPLARHIHEMLFGFVMAAIAGFLLTAIPNWTVVGWSAEWLPNKSSLQQKERFFGLRFVTRRSSPIIRTRRTPLDCGRLQPDSGHRVVRLRVQCRAPATAPALQRGVAQNPGNLLA
jgi:NnrS protein